jgi:hypothetical protein
MRRIVSALAALAMVSAAWRTAPAQDVDLQGAWLVTNITDKSGKEIEAQPGLYLFTSTHYSIMFVPGADERAQFAGTEATDDDLLGAYNTFVANSGRYQVAGDQLTLRAYVAKDPGYMAAFPDNEATATVHIAGGDTLHLTYTGEFFISGTMFTLRRVEGTPVPWESD